MEKILSSLKNNKVINAFVNNEDIIVNSIEDEALIAISAFLSSPHDIVIVKDTQYEASTLYQYISQMLPANAVFFPVDESYRIEALAASPELLIQRLSSLNQLCNNEKHIVITHPQALSRVIPKRELFLKNIIELKVNDVIDPLELQRKLILAGYKRTTKADEVLYFSKRGGVIDVYPPNYNDPIRIEFFDDEIESIRHYDCKTQRSLSELGEVTIIPATDILYEDKDVELVRQKMLALMTSQLDKLGSLEKETLEDKVAVDIENLKSIDTNTNMYAYYNLFAQTDNLLSYLNDCRVVLSNQEGINEKIKTTTAETFFYNHEMEEMGKMLKGLTYYYDFYQDVVKDNYQLFGSFNINNDNYFQSHQLNLINDTQANLLKQINDYLKSRNILIAVDDKHQMNLLIELFDDNKIKYVVDSESNNIYDGITLSILPFYKGIELLEENLVIITANELFPNSQTNKRRYIKYKEAKIIKNYQELNVGDYVVHDSYGIGQYLGINTLEVKGCHKDYLKVVYAKDSVLYIPVEQFKLIRKYSSAAGKTPKLNSLGDGKWTKAKMKARAKIDDLAQELVDIYAKRLASTGFAFPQDSEYQIEFENKFGYELTPDQRRSVAEIKSDMEKDKPMDRLLCGDVGFGKTEVALIAAFKAILGNKQVAFLCPTTILSMQHLKTATKRFQDFPVRVELLNRFVPTKKAKSILQDLKDGKIDLLIGTHKILSSNVEFKDLGLLVIDEEQRFGVRQKEKIKELRENIDVLSMTATPIPRTLQISLMGIRGLSQIETPPVNRLPVQTYVVEKSNTLIRQIIERELARGGQVFYLYNRAETIQNVAYNISLNVPGAEVVYGHGQMEKHKIEKVMQDFVDKKYNVLVATTIIETGIDIPNANTIIIDNADKFGLSQLYQIRGRVGRNDRNAYAYLMYNPRKQMTEDAQKRLKAIREFTELGSGYKLALRDLSIRGSGDILGGKQSGFIDSIGFEMYMKILQEAINEKSGKQLVAKKEVEVTNIDVDGYVPKDYVDSDIEKLEIYQELQSANDMKSVLNVQEQFIDYFGDLPKEVLTLVNKRKLDILIDDKEVVSFEDNQQSLKLLFSKKASASIAGDMIFIKASELFTKPVFNEKNGQIEIKLPKNNDYWLNNLIELLSTIKINNERI